MTAALVIFGAKVNADGSPSGTLLRRVQGALQAAKTFDAPLFVPTGGRGASGHVEADVMADLLLAADVPDARILRERAATDTLQSALLVDALLKAQAARPGPLVPCTSPYHVPRCAALLRALGWPVETRPMPGDRGHLPMRKLLWYHMKEGLALPWDLAMAQRAQGRADA